MNILYCGDTNARDGVLVSVLSLLAAQSEPLRVFVATASYENAIGRCEAIDTAFVRKLDCLLRSERTDSGAVLVDATQQFAAAPPVANLATRFTPCCMLRLYSDLMPELAGLERVLYLDVDVLCRGDVRPLYEASLNGAEIGGVLDRYGRWAFHNELRPADYLNSGVLLMDLSRMRETGLLERCRALCAEKQMFMPDQSALNKLARDKRQFPRRFNEQHKLRDDTVLQHFTTRFGPKGLITVKPWQVDRMHSELRLHAYDEVLERYLLLASDFVGRAAACDGVADKAG